MSNADIFNRRFKAAQAGSDVKDNGNLPGEAHTYCKYIKYSYLQNSEPIKANVLHTSGGMRSARTPVSGKGSVLADAFGRAAHERTLRISPGTGDGSR